MSLNLEKIGQIAFAVSSADKAEHFYEQVLGLKKLYRFGGLVFFDCGGVRLMLSQNADPAEIEKASALYFRCADIIEGRDALAARGASFVDEPHCVAKMGDHDLWMTFLRDPDQHLLALMCEAPSGYNPPTSAAT